MADLSKVKVGSTTYNLKDASARGDISTLTSVIGVNALGNAALKDVAAEITEGGAGLPTAGVVKTYVDNATAAIHNFDVRVYSTLPTASAETMYILALVADAGSETGTYVEYITVKGGTELAPTYAWEKIGTTATDLSEYVQKTTTIAGVNLQDNITNAEMQSALNLRGLAHKNSISVSYDKADNVTGSYKPAGSITINDFKQTSTAATLTFANYTPAGTITGSAINGGSISVSLKNAATASSAALTYENYTPAGQVSLSGTDIVVSNSSDTIKPVTNVGTMTTIDVSKFNGGSAATWTGQSYTAPSLGAASTNTFAQEGIKASVGTGADNETLIFTDANTASAITSRGTFSAGSLNWGTFSGGSAASLGTGFYSAGSVPTLGTAKTFLTGVEAAMNSQFGASFSGNAANIKLSQAKFYQQVVDQQTFTPTAATLGFSGTEVVNAHVTAVNYLKAEKNGASFSGTNQALSLTIGYNTASASVTLND